MLRDHELQKLRTRGKYDENNKRWILPAFFVKEREVQLPKIRNAGALIEQELEKRELVFDDSNDYQALYQAGKDAGSSISNRVLTERTKSKANPMRNESNDLAPGPK